MALLKGHLAYISLFLINCIALINATLYTLSILQRLYKSFICLFKPCKIGPIISYGVRRSIILHAILPASKFGKINMFAFPFNFEFGAFFSAICGINAASN